MQFNPNHLAKQNKRNGFVPLHDVNVALLTISSSRRTEIEEETGIDGERKESWKGCSARL